MAAGFGAVAGLDEAGRGAWAGPLVAAAVVLPSPLERAKELLEGLRDSKQCTRLQREDFFARLGECGRGIGVGIVEPHAVDEFGLASAGRRAMAVAVETLPLLPDFLLIDAFRLPGLAIPQRPIVYGDCLCLSIAAASVVAKVVRDRLMLDLHQRHPQYGFDRHKGYGTASHIRAIKECGASPIHRMTFLSHIMSASISA